MVKCRVALGLHSRSAKSRFTADRPLTDSDRDSRLLDCVNRHSVTFAKTVDRFNSYRICELANARDVRTSLPESCAGAMDGSWLIPDKLLSHALHFLGAPSFVTDDDGAYTKSCLSR